MSQLLGLGISLVERGWIPDAVTRRAIRNLCAARLRDPGQTVRLDRQAARQALLSSLRAGPVALVPHAANEQHYELPAEFFELVLGPRRKYSCCWFPAASTTLPEAEDAALQLTCEHADLQNGQEILELGCGWGSLSLWMAVRYPDSRITAVSNSASQRASIEAAARSLFLTNLRVITADMNDFSPAGTRFDRVVSVEMFEHMRNFRLLLERIGSWLRPGGKLFVHHFCHRELLYEFETEGTANWMGRYFFTGGIMPDANLLQRFPDTLAVTQQWTWPGTHYQRTADCWLANLDARRELALDILRAAYGPQDATRWLHRWRMFFLAVSELFGYAKGEEWFVSHALLEPVHSSVAQARCSACSQV